MTTNKSSNISFPHTNGLSEANTNLIDVKYLHLCSSAITHIIISTENSTKA